MAGRVEFPNDLLSWLPQHLPELGSAKNITLKACKRVPFWWLPGNRFVEGLTLWDTVYLVHTHCPIDSSNRRTVEMVLHELIHVEQFRRNPIWFPLKYAWNHLRYGYWMNPAEVEARNRAAELVRLYFKEEKNGKSHSST